MQSVAFSFTSLLVLRATLGIGEAAFVGVPFYMSFFYKRDELAFRTGFVHFGVILPLIGIMVQVAKYIAKAKGIFDS